MFKEDPNQFNLSLGNADLAPRSWTDYTPQEKAQFKASIVKKIHISTPLTQAEAAFVEAERRFFGKDHHWSED